MPSRGWVPTMFYHVAIITQAWRIGAERRCHVKSTQAASSVFVPPPQSRGYEVPGCYLETLSSMIAATLASHETPRASTRLPLHFEVSMTLTIIFVPRRHPVSIPRLYIPKHEPTRSRKHLVRISISGFSRHLIPDYHAIVEMTALAITP